MVVVVSGRSGGTEEEEGWRYAQLMNGGWVDENVLLFGITQKERGVVEYKGYVYNNNHIKAKGE